MCWFTSALWGSWCFCACLKLRVWSCCLVHRLLSLVDVVGLVVSVWFYVGSGWLLLCGFTCAGRIVGLVVFG